MKSNTLTVNKKGGLMYITFPRLSRCGVVRHTFSTKLGGVSKGKFAEMNLSFNRGDERSAVIKNYEILCGAVGIDTANLVLSHQTHTNNVRVVTKADCGTGYTLPPFNDVDGLITNQSGVALVTQYADCTPLLFCDPKKRVIATSHAGWRGTVKEIGRVTVEKMHSEFGCEPKDIIAAIGPSIAECCYEVDTPVLNEFLKLSLDLDKIFKKVDSEHYMLNLREANRQILVNSGISPDNIDISDICTNCNSDKLHSHRASKGERGNLAAIIELI